MGRRRYAKPKPSGPIATLHGAALDDKLDLHGETARTAEKKVTFFVERWCRRQPGAVLLIITGKGSGSPGDPVLRGHVRRLLDGRLAGSVEEWTMDMSGGAIIVRVGRPEARP